MIYIIEHPLLEHFLTVVKNNPTKSHFHYALKKISLLASNFVTKELELEELFDEGGNFIGYKFSSDVLLFSVFPYGFTLLQAFSNILPHYHTGFVGYELDERNQNEVYEKFCILPESTDINRVFILDFAIFRGETIKNAISRVQIENFTNISVVTIFATTDGIENVRSVFPDIPIFVCSLESKEDLSRLLYLQKYLQDISI
jgi:uracil phosphoribosyltransferase